VRRLSAVLLRLLAPARTDGWLAAAATVGLFTLGAALALVWVQSSAPPAYGGVLIAGLAGLAVLAVWARSTAIRAVSLLPLVVVHLFWIYIALSLGTLLAWTVPPAVRWIAATLALIAVVGAVLPRARFRLPMALPLGLWITACLVGWQREDGVIRCDDYQAVRASGLTVVVPTTEELERCQPGESLRVGHYPRRVWEAPEGGRLVMTTQLGIGRFAPPGRQVGDRLPGSVCDVPIGGVPSCFGHGKAQALVESPERDRLFVAAWQQRVPDGQRGVLYVLPRTAPLRPLAEVRVPESVGELYYDPSSDIVGLLSDEGEVMRPVRVSDGAVLDAVPAPIIPGDTRYDPSRGEGVVCFAGGPLKRLDGQPFLSVAFRGFPFSPRPLGGARHNPTAWLSMVWGCDWDPAARRVYVADATLGLLVVLDYDSGRVLRRIPIDFGMRYVTLDGDRGLVYLGNFLRGDVVALDLDSGAEVARWFVGRFVRHVALTRDRQALLATSNLGVVRIPLDGLPPSGAGRSDQAAASARRELRQIRRSSQ
jgi:hypothetical protein